MVSMIVSIGLAIVGPARLTVTVKMRNWCR